MEENPGGQQSMPTTNASKPWSPTAIAVLTLVFSPVVGGVLHALNYGRLGRSELRRYALASNLFASTWLVVLLLGTSRSSLGVSLLFAAYFYKTQEEYFQEHLLQGGKKSSLPMVILVALVVFIPLAFLAAAFSNALLK
jgi:hypothetical protein